VALDIHTLLMTLFMRYGMSESDAFKVADDVMRLLFSGRKN
jgi:hypothetical protein